MNKRARTRLIVVTAAILVLVGILIWRSSAGGGLQYYKTVAEIKADSAKLVGKNIRVAGFVAPKSIQRQASGLAFTVADPKDKSLTLPVFYTGTVPATFKDNADVVVDGVYGSDGKITSKSMITKCPTKFQGQASQTAGSQ